MRQAPRPNLIPLSGHWLDTDTRIGEMNENEGTAIQKTLGHDCGLVVQWWPRPEAC